LAVTKNKIFEKTYVNKSAFYVKLCIVKEFPSLANKKCRYIFSVPMLLDQLQSTIHMYKNGGENGDFDSNYGQLFIPESWSDRK
jgi:hypothetical protein